MPVEKVLTEKEYSSSKKSLAKLCGQYQKQLSALLQSTDAKKEVSASPRYYSNLFSSNLFSSDGSIQTICRILCSTRTCTKAQRRTSGLAYRYHSLSSHSRSNRTRTHIAFGQFPSFPDRRKPQSQTQEKEQEERQEGICGRPKRHPTRGQIVQFRREAVEERMGIEQDPEEIELGASEDTLGHQREGTQEVSPSQGIEGQLHWGEDDGTPFGPN